ncbi:hypothetical protein Purlil1_3706 [Purpureocillium lilacinum]|uniref:Uncharacterized protein n=1 Tax=Purpureocillium lilacinum TaxID=33203 RepID=A0ABR0C695_PURLI|nr:hypothetical protein Purlil1_3706 [Purpureocillium lilacinum]
MTASAPDLLTSFYGKGIAPVPTPPVRMSPSLKGTLPWSASPSAPCTGEHAQRSHVFPFQWLLGTAAVEGSHAPCYGLSAASDRQASLADATAAAQRHPRSVLVEVSVLNVPTGNQHPWMKRPLICTCPPLRQLAAGCISLRRLTRGYGGWEAQVVGLSGSSERSQSGMTDRCPTDVPNER